jgi:hypothetical protein
MEVTLYASSTDDEIREAARRWGIDMPNGTRRVPLLSCVPGGPDTAEVPFRGPVRRFVEFPNLQAHRGDCS